MTELVVVTGGAGYVGSALLPRLLEAGYRVRVLDKLVFGTKGLAGLLDRIELIPGDIREVDSKVFEGASAVIHLAGLSNDPTAEYNPQANESINAVGTVTCAKRAKEAGVKRFIFASTCSVYYTPTPDDTFKDEKSSIEPKAPYSATKLAAERGLAELASSQFSPVMLRKGTVYGPAPRMRYDLVVNTFTKDAFQRRELTIHAGGKMWRPMLHVEDAVDTYLAMLTAPKALIHNQVFNVLSENIRVIDIAEQTRKVLLSEKDVRIKLHVQPVGINRSYRVTGQKLQDTLGIELKRGIGEAVSEMWDVLEGGTDLSDPIFYNIRWLELLVSMKKNLETMGGSPL
jgi:nucleoside-diphosphate-sugar epimerase